jgi:hypothetical protein
MLKTVRTVIGVAAAILGVTAVIVFPLMSYLEFNSYEADMWAAVTAILLAFLLIATDIAP